MANEPTVEERLAALEAKVAELLKRQPPSAEAPAEAPPAEAKPGEPPELPGWLGKISGIVKDHEAFDQAMAYGREYRKSYRMPGEEP